MEFVEIQFRGVDRDNGYAPPLPCPVVGKVGRNPFRTAGIHRGDKDEQVHTDSKDIVTKREFRPIAFTEQPTVIER